LCGTLSSLPRRLNRGRDDFPGARTKTQAVAIALTETTEREGISNQEPPAIASLARIERLWNRSGDSERNELGPMIGSKQISDSPRSGLKEDIMAKKKTAKKKTKK
jgi:hypothetical protein